MKKPILFIAYTLVLVLLAAAGSAVVTTLKLRADAVEEGDSVTITKEEYLLLQSYGRVEQLRELIDAYYYEDVDEELLYEGAIQGMFAVLNDPYTTYLTPEQMQMRENAAGTTYRGVGCQLLAGEDDLILVARVHAESPAEKAGIKRGDYLIAIDGVPVTVSDLADAHSALASAEDTVQVTILRGEQTLQMDLTLEEIEVQRAEYRMLEDNIGYIVLHDFQQGAADAFKEALAYMEKEEAEALIVDLRGNLGGIVEETVAICDELMPNGVVVYTEDKYGVKTEYTSKASMLGMPTAILVDEMSASASEIMAMALQDTGLAEIVGVKTFGKGVVQTVYSIKEDGSGAAITTAHYYSPFGRSIDKVGVKPDHVVELPADVQADRTLLTEDNDTQLQKAIELMKEKIG